MQLVASQSDKNIFLSNFLSGLYTFLYVSINSLTFVITLLLRIFIVNLSNDSSIIFFLSCNKSSENLSLQILFNSSNNRSCQRYLKEADEA